MEDKTIILIIQGDQLRHRRIQEHIPPLLPLPQPVLGLLSPTQTGVLTIDDPGEGAQGLNRYHWLPLFPEAVNSKMRGYYLALRLSL